MHLHFPIQKISSKLVKRSSRWSEKILENFYATSYNVLTKGQLADGTSIFNNTTGVDNKSVSYPSQLANQISLGACESISKVLDDILDIVMPKNINAIFQEKMSKAGASTLL